MNEHSAEWALVTQLKRVAEALERISPPEHSGITVTNGAAFSWSDRGLIEIASFRPQPLNLLTSIEDQKQALLENTCRLASGSAAHDTLLWGSRGMGKSGLVKAIVGKLQKDGQDIALIEVDVDHLGTLPHLFDMLGAEKRAFVVFIDDIGFDEDDGAARKLRSMLEGGVAARPSNVRLYVTSNRRHILPRSLSEQGDPVNPRDAVDDKLALSDRFGLRLGFHAASQDDYLLIITRYCEAYNLHYETHDALLWAKQRGSRSGRVAWQYIVELAGREGRKLD